MDRLQISMLASQLRALGHDDLAEDLLGREMPDVILLNDEAKTLSRRRKSYADVIRELENER